MKKKAADGRKKRSRYAQLHNVRVKLLWKNPSSNKVLSWKFLGPFLNLKFVFNTLTLDLIGAA